jgi:hypothetical protein
MAAVASVTTSCGDIEDASLCTAYGEWLEAGTELRAVDPASQSAQGATEIVEDYLAAVRRLQEASDGRYTQQLSDLEALANDALLTLESIPDDAEYATWGPLVEEDRELAEDAAAQVRIAIDPSCNPDTSD